MCGICGIFNVTSDKPIQFEDIKRMANCMAHRGPDDEGYYIDKHVGLGHRRLSIIDLDYGRQPIYGENENICIIFNGEIYNFKKIRNELKMKGHHFYTNTDTEVIIHLYQEMGIKCLERFNGMFAFALWDKRNHKFYLARDRLGIKPLYYTLDDGQLIFGSEIKAILQIPHVNRQVDINALSDFLTFMYTPGEKTLFSNINKVLPGEYICIENHQVKKQKYWDFSIVNEKESSLDEYISSLDTLLNKAVRRQLISDVPLGAFLSGGIDSSLLVAIMSKYTSEPVKTFSVGFTEESFSELDYARQVAKRYSTDHHEIVVSFKDIMSQLPQLIWHRDEPLAYPSAIPTYMVSVLARNHVKVVLSGEGGDELFAGYPKYAFDDLAKYYQRVPELIRNKVLTPAISHLPQQFRRVKMVARSLGIEEESRRWTTWYSAFDDSAKTELLSGDVQMQIQNPSSSLFENYLKSINWKQALQRHLYVDSKVWLPDNLLMKGDKMTMAASIEGRVPYLDHEVVEYSFSIPAKYKIKGFSTKHILKQVAQKYLPQEILNRKKVGFAVPIGKWFKSELRGMIEDKLLSTKAINRGYFNPKIVKKIIDDHVIGKNDYQREIWSLLNFEIWHNLFIDKDNE